MSRSARIVVVDTWSVLRRGIAGVLHGQHVVLDQGATAAAVAPTLEARAVDLVVIGSVSDDDRDRIHKLVAVRTEPPLILHLLDAPTEAEVRDLLQSGVRGVLSRRVDDVELLAAVARVTEGERVIDQHFLPLLYGGAPLEAPATLPADTGPDLLTTRERDVLLLLSRGRTNRQIAESLFVGESTVKTHLGNIYSKLGVDDRHRAVGRALELGLLR